MANSLEIYYLHVLSFIIDAMQAFKAYWNHVSACGVNSGSVTFLNSS